MPSSTAARVTNASSFCRLATLMGTSMRWRGVTFSGAPISMPSVRRAGSMPSHAAPMARVGVRSAGAESGRQAVTSA